MDLDQEGRLDAEKVLSPPKAGTFHAILSIIFVFLFIFASFRSGPHTFHLIRALNVPGFRLHQLPILNLSRFANVFGFQLWTSLIGQAREDIQYAISVLFPAIHLPDKQIRRSWIYRRTPTNVSDFMNTPDVLWRSLDVQRRIFEHQNPMQCDNRRFLRIERSWGYGFGSNMHVAATHLSAAMDADRILIYADCMINAWTEGRACAATRTLECYFLPLSNCTPGNKSDIASGLTDFALFRRVPRFVIDLLNDSLVEPSAYYHYWTANAVSYMTRLNIRTKSLILNIMNDAGVLQQWETSGFDIAIHIRHGDKAREMVCVNNSQYADMLDVLRPILPATPTVFLATDDPTAVEFFRGRDGIKLFVIRHQNQDANYLAALFFLADLWACVKSKYFIGTWASNVDRWVMELKGVAAERASDVFFEASIQPCFSAVHCRELNRPAFQAV